MNDFYTIQLKGRNMNPISIYLAIASIAALAIVLNLVFVYNKQNKGLSRLAGLAFAFVIAGIFLGGQRLLGYGLLGTGMILAVIDMILKTKAKVTH
jgi:hypothetical protein